MGVTSVMRPFTACVVKAQTIPSQAAEGLKKLTPPVILSAHSFGCQSGRTGPAVQIRIIHSFAGLGRDRSPRQDPARQPETSGM